MKYNLDYLNVHYALIQAFLHWCNNNILDICYSRRDKTIYIQIVSLKGEVLSEDLFKQANEVLPDFDISINVIYLTKEEYNESAGEWAPKHYNWLDNVLFSKAEVL